MGLAVDLSPPTAMERSTKQRLKDWLSRRIQDHRRTWPVRFLARAAGFYFQAWEHPGFEIGLNGEEGVLTALRGCGIRTVFDVGANVGDWAAAASRILGGVSVYAFEPVPPTYARLAARAVGSGIRTFPYGLSDAEGSAEATYYGDENSFLSSVSAPIHDHIASTRLIITLRRGDEVVRELGIEKIDFLKIDVEGMEYEVLEGMAGTLRSRRLGFVQFEKQPGPRLLRDYFGLLEPLGYRIGKIYSRYVDFRPYDSGQERTAGPNYLAVPSDRADLIDSLQAGFR